MVVKRYSVVIGLLEYHFFAVKKVVHFAFLLLLCWLDGGLDCWLAGWPAGQHDGCWAQGSLSGMSGWPTIVVQVTRENKVLDWTGAMMKLWVTYFIASTSYGRETKTYNSEFN